MRSAADDLKPESPDAEGAVAVWDVLFYAIEVAELAARLAVALECDEMVLSYRLNNVGNFELISGTFDRELHNIYMVAADQLTKDVRVDTATLISEPRRLGVELAQGILRKFGVDLPDSLLHDWQEQALTR